MRIKLTCVIGCLKGTKIALAPACCVLRNGVAGAATRSDGL